MPQIISETQFFWKLLWHALLTPFAFVLFLIGKKSFTDLLQPLKEIIAFIFEPKFTISMIIINTIIFIAVLFFDSASSLALKPSDLMEMRLHTLVTAGFLHANIAHLLGNMIALFIFGRVVERQLGFLKTSFLYFGALILSSIFSSGIHYLILGDNSAGIGASGAIMGLVSAAILLDPFYLTYELLVPLPVMVVGWLAILADITGIMNPQEDGIGHFAHLGGFLSIALLAFAFGIEDRSKLKKGLAINVASLVIIAVVYWYVL